jgi:hypothetical protein
VRRMFRDSRLLCFLRLDEADMTHRLWWTRYKLRRGATLVTRVQRGQRTDGLSCLYDAYD